MRKKNFLGIMVSSPYTIWFIITIIAFVFLFSGIKHEGFWTDEAYTSAMVKHNFIQIIYFLASFDKHPPLYYLVLKIFAAVFGTSEISLRSFSLIGTIAMIWLGAGPIRRLFGQKIALIFTGLIIILPVTLVYSHEARMYTWANFFTLSGAIYGYSSVISNKKKDWFFFGIFTLAGMYTHYYSLVAFFFGYAIIFIYILIKSRDRIKPYLITAGCILLLYLPWIFILLNHTIIAFKDPWIPPIGFWDALYAIIVPFETKWGWRSTSIYAFFLCLIIILYGIIALIKTKNTEKEKASIFFISIFFLTVSSAILFSYFITPILTLRHMATCSGLFILSFVLNINVLKRWITQAIVCIILILLIQPVDFIILTEKFNGPTREIADEVKQRMQPDDTLIYSDQYLNFIIPMWYYLPNTNHIFLLPFNSSVPEETSRFYKSDMQIISDLSVVIGKKKRIWIFNIAYNYNELAHINPDLFIQAGYEEKYHITEYNYPHSWLKVRGTYFVLRDKSDSTEK